MPLVSVIMPAYQASSTLRRAVESVLAQDFSDYELVIINDGSTDGTAAVAEACASDPKVRLINLPSNVGAAAAMNVGWRSSDSDFVAILDADDVAVPERLRLQVEYLSAHPSTSVLGGAAHFVEEGTTFRETVWKQTHHRDLRRNRWYESPFVHPTVLMRRSFLELTGGYTDGLRLGEDYDLWMRGFMYPEVRYANLAQPLVLYTTRAVQRWQMIRASARVRRLAGEREGRPLRGIAAATRILAEGVVERTGVFTIRDKIVRGLTTRSGSPWGEGKSA
ncbi:glycosyltransferase family 2 protein [Nibricoccus sp. IMCC34717]|uniref:glycosyltransferase family 2 protein n=1 Tax=Nibricoccus sp. IMCC34717 TaxID=3034021 RepID=UPI003850EC8B